MKLFIRIITVTLFCLSLSGCNSLLDKDNTPPPTPLTSFRPEIKVNQLWASRSTNGVDNDYLRLAPAVNHHFLFTASKEGVLSATDKFTGKPSWIKNCRIEITAGPSTDDELVVLGGRNGEVIAVNQYNGAILWKTTVSSEVLAAPAINNKMILVKAIDGNSYALSKVDGHVLWKYQQVEPTLILRGASTPILSFNSAIIGYANGNLVKLNQSDGGIHWQQSIAIPQGTFAIERMIDIDANPIVFNRKIYAATYQGRIASLDFNSGSILWSQDISTYSGMAVDSNRVYVSDAKSNVWAFDAHNGTVLWHQTRLEARNITGPVVMGNYIVVGDSEGFLHWLSKEDGRFVARAIINNSGILATPVVDNNRLYAVTRTGYLAAFTTLS